MSDESSHSSDEKLRTCPSCRMSISVFATKCRFCGEEVGKPKDESRMLSLEDLGGETIVHHPSSENVMAALEAFRADEKAAIDSSRSEPKRKSRRKDKGQSEPPSSSQTGLPELSEESQELASIVTGSRSGLQTGSKKEFETSWRDRLLPTTAILAALILVLFGGVAGAGWLQEYLENRNREPEPTFFNVAPSLLEQGAEPITVLAAAAEAFRHVDSDENRKIVEDALNSVVNEFYGLLDADDWNMKKISDASRLATQALGRYPNLITRRLKNEADEENSLYRMMLRKVDTAAKTATFSLNNPNAPDITVETNDTIENRFLVKTILRRSVRVEDTRRRNSRGLYRIITYQLNAPLR